MRRAVAGVVIAFALLACSSAEILPDLSALAPRCPSDCAAPPPAGWRGPIIVGERGAWTVDNFVERRPAAWECPPAYGDSFLAFESAASDREPACSCEAIVRDAQCMYDVRQSDVCTPEAPDTMAILRTSDGEKERCVDLADGYPAIVIGTRLGPGCAFRQKRVDRIALRGTVQACSTELRVCTARRDCAALPARGSPFDHVCVHMEGDVPCPGHGYSNRSLLQLAFRDERSCTPCVGRDLTTCAGQSVRFGNGACDDPATTYADGAIAECRSAKSVLVGALPPVIACPIDEGSKPLGSVHGNNPVTFCCDG